MEGLKPPQPLQMDGNTAENWKKFELYMTASGIETKTFGFADTEDKHGVKLIIIKSDDYFEPQKNVTFERHIFNSRVQAPGESIDQFVTDLKTKANTCEYGQFCDSLIKDRIVVGIRDDSLRARLLRENDLNVPRC